MSNRSRRDPAASARGSALASDYTVSLRFDRRLYREDIAGSIAHVRMLGAQGIIPVNDAQQIAGALEQVREEIERGEFKWRDDLEDIHMNVEARLFELIGEAAGRMHTARSRNDQVVTDTRMWARSAAGDTAGRIRALQNALLVQAERHTETVMPGYTHLQRGQPILLAHHLLAYFEMLERDATRFEAARTSADVLPLGSGALAGVPYRVDREAVARDLGFSRISPNSVDAVSDRDFILDYIAAAATCAMHLSRLAEELVLWSTEEFGFVRLGDSFTTGSSIMPQKRNPDFAELMRGRTGRIYGSLVASLTLMKALPLAYNRDMQEDKERLFETVDVLLPSLEAAAGMIEGARFNAARMREAAAASDILATDLADYLVRKGVSFRKAHIAVSELADRASSMDRRIADLGLSELKAVAPQFEADALDITVEASIASRDSHGGTAPARVKQALRDARTRINDAGSQ